MVKRNSFTKFMLIVCGIVLMTAVFSGCTDADAPDTFFTEKGLQKLLDDDTPIKDIHNMIKPVAESNNYDVDVVKSDSTGKIVSIGVDDGKGNHVRFINDDDKSDVDRATLNGQQIYPTTAEATSPQTQLGGEPTGNDDDADTTTYGSTIKLYADEDSVSLKNDGRNFFEGGFDLNQLKDVETIKLQSGGHEFIYELVQQTKTDTGSIDSLWFENTNPAPGEDLRDSEIGLIDNNGDGMIDSIVYPINEDDDSKLDSEIKFNANKYDVNDWWQDVTENI